MFQIADQLRSAQIGAARWNQRLMHVQGDGEGALHAAERHATPLKERGTVSSYPNGGFNEPLGTADIGNALDVLGKLIHGLRHPSV
jgi:hypothetical protein